MDLNEYVVIVANKVQVAAQAGNRAEAIRLLRVLIGAVEDAIKEIEALP